MKSELNAHQKTLLLTLTALLTAVNIIFSSFGIPVPGGHLYLNDTVICLAALLLNPVLAFFVGGVGAFLGDLFFYPAPMFVSLVTHGLQAVVISLLVRRREGKTRFWLSVVAVTFGVVINVTGYSLGRAFLYSTAEYAWLKLPFQIVQAVFGAVVSVLLYYVAGVGKRFDKLLSKDKKA
ncbi:MAG: ECF transporter S component [Clostridia bacterium]|nr:ECF transporter S component [Clostridia bacterium]